MNRADGGKSGRPVRPRAPRRAGVDGVAVWASSARELGMTDHEEFLTWFKTTLYQAELALHNGDPAPRRALWSRNEPVSVLGAWRNALGQQEIDDLFAYLANSFSDCTSSTVDVLACDVLGDMAYTAVLEHTSVSVDGQPQLHPARHAGVPPGGRPMAGRASPR